MDSIGLQRPVGQPFAKAVRSKSAVLRTTLEPHRRSMIATLLQLMRSADRDATRLEAVKLMLAYLDGKPDAFDPSMLTDEDLLRIVTERMQERERSRAQGAQLAAVKGEASR